MPHYESLPKGRGEARNLPAINATIHPDQKAKIQAWGELPGYSFSRVLREMIHFALAKGYRPGVMGVGEMVRMARERGGGH